MKKFHLLFALISIYLSAFSQAPTISNFSPASGPVGTLVKIKGTNLSNNTSFTIAGVSLILISNTDTTLVGYIMPGTVTGTISVSNYVASTTSVVSFIVTPTPYPITQQGNKLGDTGTDADYILQGWSVAISAEGNTAIVGSPDYGVIGTGSSWIYTRSGNIWKQQGPKLIGNDGVGASEQGWAVSLSADGNTAIVGGPQDVNSNGHSHGAVWIYTRTDTIWTQQGPKLAGNTIDGYSVSLSADGNTALIRGAPSWVYTRSAGLWTPMGSLGMGAIPQAMTVALSADGNTAIIGEPGDSLVYLSGGSAAKGSAWIYINAGGFWLQQGPKLKGNDAEGFASQGASVALSADGNTAIVGGPNDNNGSGAAWIYTRSGGVWSQQGPKLLGTGATGPAGQGTSVSISADGNTAIVGGADDNSLIGATWVFTRIDTIWVQKGPKMIGTGAANGPVYQGCSVCLSADGSTAILGGYYNSGQGAAWIFSLDSCCLGLTDITNEEAIHLYPNPNKGSFTLETSQSIGADYIITDMLGNVITQQSIRSDKQLIELPEAAEGVYTLSVKGASPIRFVIVK